MNVRFEVRWECKKSYIMVKRLGILLRIAAVGGLDTAFTLSPKLVGSPDLCVIAFCLQYKWFFCIDNG